MIIGCLAVGAAPAFAQSKALIQRLNDEWTAAFTKRDSTAVTAMYTVDAYVLPPSADIFITRSI